MKYLFAFCLIVLSLKILAQESPEARLEAANLELPEPSKPVANYRKYVRTGNLIYLAGHGSCGERTEVDTGKLGQDLTVEQGYQAARRVGLCLLATLKDAVGDLSKVTQIVEVTGMVNSAPDFYDQPKVVNGCSDLLVEVFGEKGKHARAAVGMASLPGNITVEIKMVVEVQD